jgi:CheY-like chemotaxis protein
MGGSLSVNSTLDQGSCFALTLARADARPGPALPAADLLPPPLVADRRWRVLYVEDNPSNRELMAQLLSTQPSVTLQTAADGLQGLALLKASPPDLAILDIDLPGMDGLSLCRRVRSDPTLARLPLMALTAQAMQGDLQRMQAAGFDAVVTKPLDVGLLLGELRRLLGDRTD